MAGRDKTGGPAVDAGESGWASGVPKSPGQRSEPLGRRRGLRRGAGHTLAKQLSTSVALVALAVGAAGCASGVAPTGAPPGRMVEEYVGGGHWVSFRAGSPLSAKQWAVVAGYANFTAAVLDVYARRSVLPLDTVVSPQSMAPAMFSRDLATGVIPEALYTAASVDRVSITGCRATLSLTLSYPGGRSLHYVSSWVLPFDRPGSPRGRPRSSATARLAHPVLAQAAPWLFVGDDRVGGLTTPCGI